MAGLCGPDAWYSHCLPRFRDGGRRRDGSPGSRTDSTRGTGSHRRWAGVYRVASAGRRLVWRKRTEPQCGRLHISAGMAFMASGSTPGRGPYDHVDRCVDLLRHTEESGFINIEGALTHGPMYGHGFATLFLAEAYGMTMRPAIRPKLSKAVNLIVQTQNSEGGWRVPTGSSRCRYFGHDLPSDGTPGCS